MPEYTFLITDYNEVKSKVTLQAVNFDNALDTLDALMEEKPRFVRLIKTVHK